MVKDELMYIQESKRLFCSVLFSRVIVGIGEAEDVVGAHAADRPSSCGA
jgi:hypothetical protein